MPGKTKGIYHTVKKKQTLWSICNAYNVNLQDIAEINNIDNPSQIKVGDRLFIPGATKVLYVPPTVKQKPRTNGKPKSTRPKTKPPKIVKHTGTFIWPLKGSIIKKFGMYNGTKHDGIDIKARAGTQVVAAGSGKVVFANYLEGYGNTIIMQHGDNYATVYANNGKQFVSEGQWVSKGKKIASVGYASGSKKTAYLHFQVRRYNRPRNPLFYLPSR